MRVSLQQAIDLLEQGHVVALPTETVYGLAASARSEKAIHSLYRQKKRPADNPLIVHVSCLEQVHALTQDLPPQWQDLAARFWPGPLTLILPANEKEVFSCIRAHQPTVAVRMPLHPLTLAVIEKVGPIVAPSANLSGRPSSTSVEHVENDFGPNFPVLDGGRASEGIESTILFYQSGWRLARFGAIARQDIEKVVDLIYEPCQKAPACPGSKYRHYAPKARLHLGQGPYLGYPDFVIGYKGRHYKKARCVEILGSLASPDEIARNLFAALRRLDERGIKEAWVDLNIPPSSSFDAIRDRLNRACLSK